MFRRAFLISAPKNMEVRLYNQLRFHSPFSWRIFKNSEVKEKWCDLIKGSLHYGEFIGQKCFTIKYAANRNLYENIMIAGWKSAEQLRMVETLYPTTTIKLIDRVVETDTVSETDNPDFLLLSDNKKMELPRRYERFLLDDYYGVY